VILVAVEVQCLCYSRIPSRHHLVLAASAIIIIITIFLSFLFRVDTDRCTDKCVQADLAEGDVCISDLLRQMFTVDAIEAVSRVHAVHATHSADTAQETAALICTSHVASIIINSIIVSHSFTGILRPT